MKQKLSVFCSLSGMKWLLNHLQVPMSQENLKRLHMNQKSDTTEPCGVSILHGRAEGSHKPKVSLIIGLLQASQPLPSCIFVPQSP